MIVSKGKVLARKGLGRGIEKRSVRSWLGRDMKGGGKGLISGW